MSKTSSLRDVHSYAGSVSLYLCVSFSLSLSLFCCLCLSASTCLFVSLSLCLSHSLCLFISPLPYLYVFLFFCLICLCTSVSLLTGPPLACSLDCFRLRSSSLSLLCSSSSSTRALLLKTGAELIGWPKHIDSVYGGRWGR